MTMTEDDVLLTVPEVAARLRVNADTVRRWLRNGRIRGVLVGKTRAGWRVKVSEVAAFVDSGAEPKQPA